MEHQKRCRKCGGDKFVLHGRDKAPKGQAQGPQRYSCTSCGYRTVNPYVTAREIDELNLQHEYLMGEWDGTSDRYVVTCAQNATPVNPEFFTSLLRYADETGAKLVCIPHRYKNPTSIWTDHNDEDEWWAKEVEPYLFNGRQDIGEHLTLLADLPITPTAVNPLSGLDSFTADRSGIVGHPKLQLKAIPTPQSKLPKIMTTTGSVTVKNYTNTKTGKKGEFHHTFGAAVVELEGGRFHLRQINALPNGEFCDVDTIYAPDGAYNAGPAEALVMGDLHVDYLDPRVVAATITDKDSMVNVLRPKTIVLHDVLDMYSRGHHTIDDPFVGAAKYKDNRDDVLQEVVRACEWVDMLPKDIKVVLVPSNHHDHLYKWMEKADWKRDPVNAEMYLETALHMVRESRMGEGGAEVPDPFLYWAKRLIKSKDRCVFLERDDSYLIAGIEVGLHGDMGANGARASGPGMAKMGVKTVLGHTHVPMIYEGAYWAGTSSVLRRDFNHGASSWLNSHVAIYPTGKRSILSIVDGHWRLI